MKSVLHKIITLRGGKVPEVDFRNSNRYCVIAAEDNGTKTAYCFGVPIYNKKSKRLVCLKFYENSGVLSAYGSDAAITIMEGILLENEDGFCEINLPGDTDHIDGTSVRYGNAEIFPTLNGILVKVSCMAHQPYESKLLSGQPFMDIWTNDRCFSLMREAFKPFVTVSCIGAFNSDGKLVAPCSLEYQKNSDREYTLTLRHTSPYGITLLFEVNLHAEKLFQDTTVESLHPNINNAFGGTAFIGNTAAYGEQWLYSRPDFSKLPELYDKQIRKATWHLPRFGGCGDLTAFGLTARFCSFGSNWENKIQAAEKVADAASLSGYRSLDITNLITDSAHFLKPSEGLILKPKVKDGGFSAVSTGDSYFAPQILEVNFR